MNLDQIVRLSPQIISQQLAGETVILDLRNVYERGLMEEHGFLYGCVGR